MVEVLGADGSGAASRSTATFSSRLSGEFAQDMARLEAEIFGLAGETFNLGSPKQLGDILFGKMGLPGAQEDRDRRVVDRGRRARRTRRAGQ